MVICLFGLTYRADADLAEEAALDEMLLDEARALDGFISSHVYSGEGGEVLGVIRFATRASLEAWRENQLHRALMARAPSLWESFWIQSCETFREYVWTPLGRLEEDMADKFRSDPANLALPSREA